METFQNILGVLTVDSESQRYFLKYSCNPKIHQPSLALHYCITNTFCVLHYLVHDYKDLDTFLSLTLKQLVDTVLFVLGRGSAEILLCTFKDMRNKEPIYDSTMHVTV